MMCPDCHGAGDDCNLCNGSGFVAGTVELESPESVDLEPEPDAKVKKKGLFGK